MSDSLLERARRFFTGMFYDPDSDDLGKPSDHGFAYEDVTFPSGSNRLHGFLLKAEGRRKGTILHCHGNAGNVTSHFPLVAFLVRAGYDVLVFDYAGYGRSEGQPSLPGLAVDARAALSFLLKRTDTDLKRIAVFGQSLGGAAAAAAAEHTAVRCLILEATFTTFRDMARATFIGRALLPIVSIVIPEGGPAAHLENFAPRPILILHGNEDTVVPVKFSHLLHALVKSHGRLVIEKDVDHLIAGGTEVPAFASAMLMFLDEHLENEPKNRAF